MTYKPYEQGRIFIGRIPLGADLLAAITRIANEQEIKLGTVMAHGMLSRVTLTVFNQATKAVMTVEREGGTEIAGLSGTISQFKGRSMARLSGTFAFPDGSVIGGNIGIGSVVYACEVVITELIGGVLSRDYDQETGLPLWKDTSLLLE
jgi:predicted DNA-binding protein with PD1-like motif